MGVEVLGAATMKRRFSSLLFVVALVLFLGCIPFGDFDTIIGDNIAQVAYWRVLFHRQLVGSIGASVMKPALIVVLGLAHDSSLKLLGSTVFIQFVFALVAAYLVSVVGSIAKDVSGTWLAGCAAAVYLLLATPIPAIYTTGSSMIAFFPPMLAGVQAFARQRRVLGCVILCLAALIRLEAFAVLLWLSISEQLLRSRWREFLVTSAITAATLLFMVGVFYGVQGSAARFGAGGPATGYVFGEHLDLFGRVWSMLTFSVKALYLVAFEDCGFPYLAVPALYALFREHKTAPSYASLSAIPLFWLVCVTLGQGQPELRYFQFLIPMVACFGAAGVVIAFRDGGELTPSRVTGLAAVAVAGILASLLAFDSAVALSTALVVAPALLGRLLARTSWSPPARFVPIGVGLSLLGAVVWAVVAARFPKPTKRAEYTKDAGTLLQKNPELRGAAVLTEDDIIYSVIVRDSSYFSRAAALQDFNVRDERRRTKVLRNVDFVVISKGKHSWYYLRYDPRNLRKHDPFRAAVSQLIKRKRRVKIYGSRLVRVQNDRHFLVLQVQHQS